MLKRGLLFYWERTYAFPEQLFFSTPAFFYNSIAPLKLKSPLYKVSDPHVKVPENFLFV